MKSKIGYSEVRFVDLKDEDYERVINEYRELLEAIGRL